MWNTTIPLISYLHQGQLGRDTITDNFKGRLLNLNIWFKFTFNSTQQNPKNNLRISKLNNCNTNNHKVKTG